MAKVNGMEVDQVVLSGKEFQRLSKLVETKHDAEAIFKNLFNLLRKKGVSLNVDYENLLNNKFDDASVTYDNHKQQMVLHIRKK